MKIPFTVEINYKEKIAQTLIKKFWRFQKKYVSALNVNKYDIL